MRLDFRLGFTSLHTELAEVLHLTNTICSPAFYK